MEKQLIKLIAEYEEKITAIEKEIDSREDQGLDCYAHYGLLTGYDSAMRDLKFLLKFMKED